ncbi:hypothetical protein Q0601_02440 [Paracoccus onubensis]|uniref:hypothetical protein n=1 Tax=Paracoccus onubensis TaxID=1675788 RepID=UPI002731C762|nr:hypothetical protein [Paracoccus onubensis]MDP0926022.1 hypothetical protein [Paracoccus onubensis]
MEWIEELLNPSTIVALRSLEIQQGGLYLARASFFLSIAVSVISSLGIIAALWTAYLTRKSVRSANEALKLSHSIGRAWLAHSSYRSGELTESIIDGSLVLDGIIIRIAYKNCGQTPALQVHAQSKYDIVPRSQLSFKEYFSEDRTCGQMMLAPGEERHFDIHLNEQETKQLREKAYDILIEVVLDYKTVAEGLGIRRTRLSYRGAYNEGTIATDGQQSGILTAVSGPLGDFSD